MLEKSQRFGHLSFVTRHLPVAWWAFVPRSASPAPTISHASLTPTNDKLQVTHDRPFFAGVVSTARPCSKGVVTRPATRPSGARDHRFMRNSLATLLFLLLLTSARASDFPRFRGEELDPHVGDVCYAVTVADVDGDNKTDVVAVTEDA